MQCAWQFAPISGVVQEVNVTLNDQPSLLNKSPEQDGACAHTLHVTISPSSLSCVSLGWLCKVKLSDPAEVGKAEVVTLRRNADTQTLRSSRSLCPRRSTRCTASLIIEHDRNGLASTDDRGFNAAFGGLRGDIGIFT